MCCEVFLNVKCVLCACLLSIDVSVCFVHVNCGMLTEGTEFICHAESESSKCNVSLWNVGVVTEFGLTRQLMCCAFLLGMIILFCFFAKTVNRP